MNALNVLCAQLTCDLFAIAKLFFYMYRNQWILPHLQRNASVVLCCSCTKTVTVKSPYIEVQGPLAKLKNIRVSI